MKKILLILLLFISINVYAEDTMCILGHCITEGTLTKDGDTGHITADFDNKTITFDNFNKVISNQNEISTIPFNGYEYNSIAASNMFDFDIIIKGNNSIIVDDLNGLSFSIFNGSQYNIKGIDDGKIDITFNEREEKDFFQIAKLKMQSGQSLESRVINIDDVEINVEAKDGSLKGLAFVCLDYGGYLNINNSKLSMIIGNNNFTEYSAWSEDFSGLVATHMKIIDSDFTMKMNYRTQNLYRGLVTKDLECISSNISIEGEKCSSNSPDAIGYRDDTSELDIYKFKDSKIHVKFGSGSYGNGIISKAQSVVLEFDNTEIDIHESSVGAFDFDNEPEVTFKNYNEKVLKFKKYVSGKGFVYSGLNEKLESYASISTIETIDKGQVKTNINNINEYVDDNELNDLYLGNDITISIVNEEITDPTESIINSINTKKGNGTIIGYYSIEVVKEAETTSIISNLKKEMEQEIVLDDQYINNDPKVTRTYKVIRIHGDDVDTLDATFDPTTKKLTFKSDKYSVFAVVYYDSNISNPKTGDNLIIYILLSIISFLSLITINKRTIRI